MANWVSQAAAVVVAISWGLGRAGLGTPRQLQERKLPAKIILRAPDAREGRQCFYL